MSTDTEELVDLGINIDEDLPCTWSEPECDKSGTWGVWHSCCGMVATFCDEHRIEEEVWVRVEKAKGNTIFCMQCQTVPESYRWVRL